MFENKIELIKSYSLKNNIQSKCFVVIKIQNNEDTGVALNSQFIAFLHKLKMTLEVSNYIDEEAG